MQFRVTFVKRHTVQIQPPEKVTYLWQQHQKAWKKANDRKLGPKKRAQWLELAMGYYRACRELIRESLGDVDILEIQSGESTVVMDDAELIDGVIPPPIIDGRKTSQ